MNELFFRSVAVLLLCFRPFDFFVHVNLSVALGHTFGHYGTIRRVVSRGHIEAGKRMDGPFLLFSLSM